MGNQEVFHTLGPRQKCFLGFPKLRGFLFPFCSRRTFLFVDLAAVNCCRSVAVPNRLPKAECNALKKGITCPCQDAHAAQYLSESSAVASPQKSQFNLCLPLANEYVPLAENLPDSPPPPACQGKMQVPGLGADSGVGTAASMALLPQPLQLKDLGVCPPLKQVPRHTATTRAQENTSVTAFEPSPGVHWPHSRGNNARLRAGDYAVGGKQNHPKSSSER